MQNTEEDQNLQLLDSQGALTVHYLSEEEIAGNYEDGLETQGVFDEAGVQPQSYIESDATEYVLELAGTSVDGESGVMIHGGEDADKSMEREGGEVISIVLKHENRGYRTEQTDYEDPTGDLQEEHFENQHEQVEQDKGQCANCFSKLKFQKSRGKRFDDPLYPAKSQFEAQHHQNLNRHKDKEVTVLEALDLLFDLKAKSESSSVRLSEDYVFCFKCVSTLAKLHTLFVEFTEVSKTPSFMRFIFDQYGVLSEFTGVLDEFSVKIESEVSRDEAEIMKEDFGYDYHSRSVPSSSSPSSCTKKRKSSRLPRSCNRQLNYRKLARLGQHSSKHNDDISFADADDHGLDDSMQLSEPENVSLVEKFDSDIPFKKRQNRLTHLKERIKSLKTEEAEAEAEQQKKRPGRPRKRPITRSVDENSKNEVKEEVRTPKKAQYKGSDTGNTEVEESGVKESDVGEGKEEKPKRRGRKPIKFITAYDSAEDEGGSDYCPEEAASDTEKVKRGGNTSKERNRSRKEKRLIQCTKCCAKFQKQSHYSDHLKVHTGDSLKCSDCNGTFNTPRNLKRHITLYHRERTKKLSTPRQFLCPECSFSFNRKTHLKTHLLSQHKIDPDTVIGNFPCSICKRKHYTEVALQAHLERKHTVRIREKKNACEECGRRFLKKSDLDNHMTTHTNIRRFMCEICGFHSKRTQDLTRHRKLVHLKEVKHTCPTCGKGFLSLWQMKSHQLCHDEYKGFACPEPGCGKSFRCPNNLRQHASIHQGVKHVCQYCGESYSRTAYLARHIKVNHLGLPAPPSKLRKKEKKAPPPKPKGRKPKYRPIKTDNIEIVEHPEPLELDIDLPTEDGRTQQVILHGFDDKYEGIVMEYIIG